MRIVIIGASQTAIETAKHLLENNHEVVIIETDQDRIDALSDTLECGFLCGDGSRPSLLREASPENTDVLLCLSNSDQSNIIAALVGRALEFERVILKIGDPEFQPICAELKLNEVFLPDQEFGRSLLSLVETHKRIGLTAEIQGDLRFFNLKVTKDETGKLADLELPDGARAVALTRDSDSRIIDEETTLKVDDEVLILTPADEMETLNERFENAGGGGVGGDD